MSSTRTPSWSEGLEVLGLTEGCSEAQARSSYRRLLHSTHPDRSAASDATDRTVFLTAAYEVVIAHLRASEHIRSTPGSAAAAEATVTVDFVDAETIAIAAPAVEVVPMLVEAAHRLGDISYIDPSVGLLEVIVEFVGAPTSSVVLTLQGRANGTTEVFCSVEALSGGEVPGADAVANLLVRTLRGEDPTT